MASPIKTFVFFDLEGTGLTDNPRITEISLLAIHRSALESAECDRRSLSLEDRSQFLPRVLNKLTVCMYPMKSISPEAADLTGLYNDMLLNQKDFDRDLASLMSLFLCRLEPPVCIVSHNGFRFDFPLLRAELASIACDLPAGLLCLDSWEMFRSLDGCPVLDRSHYMVLPKNLDNQSKKSRSEIDLSPETNKITKREKKDDCVPLFIDKLFKDDACPAFEQDSGENCYSRSALEIENSAVESHIMDSCFAVSLDQSKPENSAIKHLSSVDAHPIFVASNTTDANVSLVKAEDKTDSQKSTVPTGLATPESATLVDHSGVTNLAEAEANSLPSRVSSECVTGIRESDFITKVDDIHPRACLHGTDIAGKFSEGLSDDVTKQAEKFCNNDENKDKICVNETHLLNNASSVDRSTESFASSSVPSSQNERLIAGCESVPEPSMQRKEYHARNSKKRLSYRLGEIHLRVVGCYPSGCHSAEDDCLALARIFLFTPNCVEWADNHAVPFAAFTPMFASSRKHLPRGAFPVNC